MTYTKQYEAIRDAQISLGIQTSAKTQVGRKLGASFAENAGASEVRVPIGHKQYVKIIDF
jgi:hypothetical protein